MMDDRYKGGRFLRRWSLVGGYPACVLDALDTQTARPEAIAAAEAENARVRALVTALEAHEAAERAARAADPPRPVPPRPPALAALLARRAGEDQPGGVPFLRALVKGGTVRQVVYADHDWSPVIENGEPWDVVAIEAPVEIGSTWDGEAFTPPPPWGGPVPTILRLLPFLAAMAEAGLVSAEEALAAARTGAVPAVVDAVFDQLPPAQAFAGRLAWAAMVDVERSNPLLNVVAAAAGKTAADMDAVFRRGGEIAAQEVGA